MVFGNRDLRLISVTFPLGTADIYILDEQGYDEGSVELSVQVIFSDGCYRGRRRPGPSADIFVDSYMRGGFPLCRCLPETTGACPK